MNPVETDIEHRIQEISEEKQKFSAKTIRYKKDPSEKKHIQKMK